ncbi:hypothetical protein [Anabaena azotica]|uniref:hypothetical protein n=1 Tax=Anabaena azotica TaxID=197653 RepID=UPI001682A314|nr:hypothetical protein [Anabaena azotica]
MPKYAFHQLVWCFTKNLTDNCSLFAVKRGDTPFHVLIYADIGTLGLEESISFAESSVGGESSPVGGFPAVGNWRTRRGFPP